MCQAYEGERNFILAQEQWARKKGYEAQKQGKGGGAEPLPRPVYARAGHALGHRLGHRSRRKGAVVKPWA